MTPSPSGGPAAARREGTGTLESHLRARRDAGRKLLVPYVTGGMAPDWVEAVHAVAESGADAVEVGHPLLRSHDRRSGHPGGIAAGTAAGDDAVVGARHLGARRSCRAVVRHDLLQHRVPRRFAPLRAVPGRLRGGGRHHSRPSARRGGRVVCRGRRRRGGHGAPRRPLHAAGPGPGHLRARPGVRLRRGRHGGDGGAGDVGVERGDVARMLRPLTDRPVCIGIGVSTPEQAAEACADADGVVVGSAIVRRLLDGAGPGRRGRVRGVAAGRRRRRALSPTRWRPVRARTGSTAISGPGARFRPASPPGWQHVPWHAVGSRRPPARRDTGSGRPGPLRRRPIHHQGRSRSREGECGGGTGRRPAGRSRGARCRSRGRRQPERSTAVRSSSGRADGVGGHRRRGRWGGRGRGGRDRGGRRR